jgi:hypothetical protein
MHALLSACTACSERGPAFVAALARALALCPLHAQQPVVAIRARAMVDVERGVLIENVTVVIRERERSSKVRNQRRRVGRRDR